MRALAFAAILSVTAGAANAETHLFDTGNWTAWVDLRIAHADGERGWLDGGFGKLRHGDETSADIAHAAVMWKPQFTDTVSGNVLLQGISDARVPVGVEEMYLQWKPVPKSDFRYRVRFGQMFPPISMEHDGTGWTTKRTLTPSAINSWVGEEILVQGLEVNASKGFGGHTLGVTLGGFTRNDTSGTILSWRGWALHDMSSAENTELTLPDGPQGYKTVFKTSQADYSRPVVELDGRTGYYARIDWRPPVPLALNAEIYDNQADPQVDRNGQWGWATRFYNIGAAWQLNPRDEVLGQYMAGRTETGWQVGQGRRVVDVSYESAYVLWSRHYDDDSRLSGRVDWFATKDFTRRAVDDNSETGFAATVAWLRPLTDHLDIGIEAVHVASDRPARASQGLPSRQPQTQLQIALKLHL